MRISRKKLAAIAAGALTLGVAGAAFGYWTTTGEGTGSANVAASNGTVTLHASIAGPAIVPGADRDVTFTADNGGSSNLWVGTIHLASVTADENHEDCDVSDFSMDDVTSDSMVAAGASAATITGTGSLEFANSDVNQDACKGAEITLHLTSN